MCIRAGKDELDSVKNLMSMSLKAVVAEALHVEMEAIDDDTRLLEDLHMGVTEAENLKALIADIFDGVQLDPRETPNFRSLLERVVLVEFRDLAA
jgi:hypothetical protein